jgi:NAD(P)-dependent dehydrogenase (short-subunit alcohol dehydrogenase family)
MGEPVPGALDGQVAVVTGGASGIGRATVLRLAGAGARVAVVDLAPDGAERTAKEATQLGGDAAPFVVDLADRDAIPPLVLRVLETFGRIDILVNCAGITGAPHNALDFTDEKYDAVMAVNLRAPFVLTREVGRHMVERGGGGRIVNISSSAAFRATAAPAIYAATKAGINGLTRASAGDLAPHGVNVNAVAPGVTRTPIVGGGEDGLLEKMVAAGPLANLTHRVAEPEDVANLVHFLCLPESRQITGQVIHTSAGLIV